MLTVGVFDLDEGRGVGGGAGAGGVHRQHPELVLVALGQVRVVEARVEEWLAVDARPAGAVRTALLDDVAQQGGTTVITRSAPAEVQRRARQVERVQLRRSARLRCEQVNRRVLQLTGYNGDFVRTTIASKYCWKVE